MKKKLFLNSLLILSFMFFGCYKSTQKTKKRIRLTSSRIPTERSNQKKIDSIPRIVEVSSCPTQNEHLTYNIFNVDQPPRFLASKKLPKGKAAKDFLKKVKLFFSERLKIPKASSDLPSGRYRIYSMFTIDEEGNVVDIQVRSSYPKFKKEVENISQKLPHFTPAKHMGKTIKLTLTLPIVFKID